MNTIFINSENSKTSDTQRLFLNLTDKIDLRRKDKYNALSSIYYAWENIKYSCKNNRFKISASTWIEEFELPYGSYSISGIKDYFEKNIKKKHGEKTVNLSMKIYINKIENRVTFKIKTGYYLELLTSEATKLLRNTKSTEKRKWWSQNSKSLEIEDNNIALVIN